MASLVPITSVQFLAIIVRFSVDKDSIHQAHGHDELPWYDWAGVKELLETLEITLPLIILFFILIKFAYKSQIPAVYPTRLYFLLISSSAWSIYSMKLQNIWNDWEENMGKSPVD